MEGRSYVLSKKLEGLTPFLFNQKLYKYRNVLYFVKACHGICYRLKCLKTTRPIYDNHRRCTKCEVYYTKDITICPCCKIVTRSKPANSVNREKYNNRTIRMDNHETRYIHSAMLSS